MGPNSIIKKPNIDLKSTDTESDDDSPSGSLNEYAGF